MDTKKTIVEVARERRREKEKNDQQIKLMETSQVAHELEAALKESFTDIKRTTDSQR